MRTSAHHYGTSSNSIGCKTRKGQKDHPSTDIQLDQYYTKPATALYLYGILKRLFNLSLFLLIEPSAGDGAFFRLMPSGSEGYDKEPKYPGITLTNFFDVDLERDRDVMVIGNPPFGRGSKLAIDFFNHAAKWAKVIAFILPRTVRKVEVQAKLDRRFRLVCEEILPENSFLFRSKSKSVPTVFQVWVRCDEPREVPCLTTSHPRFAFTTNPTEADFAIQRIGARAGRIHHDFSKSPSSHLFIKGKVEHIMAQLNLEEAARDCAGCPCIAKKQIVHLFKEWETEGPPVFHPA